MELDSIRLNTTWNDAADSINLNFAKIQQALLLGGGGGLDEASLAQYLTSHGYATQAWVGSLGYVTGTEINERLAPLELLLDWFKYDAANNAIYTDKNFYSKLQLAAGGVGTGGSGSGVGGGIAAVLLNGTQYPPDDYGIIALPDLATAAEHDALRSEFDALYKTLNDDTSGVINTWQEVVDFVNEYSGSEDLSTILSKMNAEIATKASETELANAIARIAALEGDVSDLNVLLDWFKIDADGNVYTERNFYSKGQIAAGGIGDEEQGSGAGVLLLNAWPTDSADYSSYALGGNLGVDLNSRVSALEGKATAVSFSQTLTSGKQIGVLTIDNDSKVLYAPATYAWGDIAEKPTTLAGYGITDAKISDGVITIGTQSITPLPITGNAASATKLQTAVSLWGNSFDGTSDIKGNLYLNNSQIIASKTADATSVALLTLNDANYFLLGQGSAKQGCDTNIYGNNIHLCYSTVGNLSKTALTITSAGNVLIGTTNDLGYKLRVVGNASFYNKAYFGNAALTYFNDSGDLRMKAFSNGGWARGLSYHSNDESQIHAQIGAYGYVNPDAGEDYLRYVYIGGGNSPWSNPWFKIKDTYSAFSVPVTIGNSTPLTSNDCLFYVNGGAKITSSLTIGTIVLTDENGTLKISGNAYTTGQLAAGAAGSAEEGGAGIGLLFDSTKSWLDYTSDMADYALAAYHGKELNDRLAAVEGKATDVSFTQTLLTGKPIGTIMVDGVSQTMFAPSRLSQMDADFVDKDLLPYDDGACSLGSASRQWVLVCAENIEVSGSVEALLGEFRDLNAQSGVFTDLDVQKLSVYSDFLPSANNTGNIGGTSQWWNSAYITSVRTKSVYGNNNLTLFTNGGYIELYDNNGDIDDVIANFTYSGSRIYTDLTVDGNIYARQASIQTLSVDLFNIGDGAYEFEYDNLGVYINRDKIILRSDLGGLASKDSLAFSDLTATPTTLAGYGITDAKISDGVITIGTQSITPLPITGNAASATKLANSVSLWGNAFDGTQSLYGDIRLKNSYAITSYLTDGTTNVALLTLNANNNFLLGQGSAKQGCDTNIYGNNIHLCYSTVDNLSKTALTITSAGNVLIGTTNDLGYKLRVVGNASFYNKAYFGNAALTYFNDSGDLRMKAFSNGGWAKGLCYYSNDESQIHAQIGAYGYVNPDAGEDYLRYVYIGGGNSPWSNPWFKIKDTYSAFSVPVTIGNSTPLTSNDCLFYVNGGAKITSSLTIGTIVLTDENGTLKISGNAYTTGQLAAGAAGGVGQDGSAGNSVTIDMSALYDLYQASGITQAQMSQYGLTQEVVSNMLDGMYTKVVHVDSSGYRQCLNYSGYEDQHSISIQLFQGDGYDVMMGVSLRYEKDTQLWSLGIGEI